MGHKFQVVLQQGIAVAVWVVVVVSHAGIATNTFLPPVRHTVAVGIPIGSTMLLRPFLPTAIGRISNVGLVVNFTLDIRLRALVGPCAVERLTDVTLVLLVAHGHGGTTVAGHNLHGILGRVDGGIGRE